MRKDIFILTVASLIVLQACNVENSSKYKALEARLDSLQGDYINTNASLEEAFLTINEVEKVIGSIRESEKVLLLQSNDQLNIPQESEEKIKNDVAVIKESIAKYQKEIAKLQKDNKFRSIQFSKKLAAMQSELKEKEALITELYDQIEKKNIQLSIKTKQISSLDKLVSNLKTDVNKLSTEGTELKNKINEQERELRSAYYIVGTKDELIETGVMTKGGLFKSSKVSYQAEKTSFVAIDYLEISQINTNAKKAKILSIHPESTYHLEEIDDEAILTITKPEAFWEQTKYLVIQVTK